VVFFKGENIISTNDIFIGAKYAGSSFDPKRNGIDFIVAGYNLKYIFDVSSGEWKEDIIPTEDDGSGPVGE